MNEETKKDDNKILSAKIDRIFKTIMINNKELLECILEIVLERKVKIIEFLNQELPVRQKQEKEKRLDLLIDCGGEYYNVEMNTSSGLITRFRNICYFCSFISQNIVKKEKYNVDTLFMQVNFNFGLPDYFEKEQDYHFLKFEIQSDEQIKYYSNIKFYSINMDKIMDSWYHKDKEFIEKYKYLIMLGIDNVDELEEFCQGDGLMEKFKKEMVNLNSDKKFIFDLTLEEEKEYMRNTEIYLAEKNGIEQKALEVAKDMLLKNKYSDEEIISISKIKQEQLSELKEKLNLNSDKKSICDLTIEEEKEYMRNTEIYLAEKNGIEQKALEVAKNMLNKGTVDDEFIIEVTGITKEQLEKIK